MLNSIRLCLLALLIIFANPLYAGDQSISLKITTSIKPLGLMLTELTQNTSAQITVLIPANQSSHDFSLKPKDIVRLQQADLIVWVGPELESFLHKPIQAHSEQMQNSVLTLLTAPSIKTQLLPLRTGAKWHDVHHHHDDHDAHDDHMHENHEHHGIDPHIWLSPELNLEIARLITKKLISLNPAQANQYLTNFKQFAHQLIDMDKLYRETFKHSAQRYLVLHDSYQYLEKHYHLDVAGVLSMHPDRPASVKTLKEAQENIASSQVTCILGEPPFQPKLLQVLLEGPSQTKTKTTQLAPLADAFELKVGNYQKWQSQMVKQIGRCE